MIELKFASPAMAPALLAIYGQYIDTPATFEYQLPSEAEFAARIQQILKTYPYLVCEIDGKTVGYAYAHRYKERAAYQWGVELSVYLHEAYTGRKIGSALYHCLFDILRLQGVQTIYSGVTSPNPKSVALHESCGFRLIGTYRNSGFKGGKWHDVLLFEKPLSSYSTAPRPVTPITALSPSALSGILKIHTNEIK